MKRWNVEQFGHIGKRKRSLFRRIRGLQAFLEDQSGTPSDFHIQLESSLREDLEEVCFQEELLWLQKSSSEWISLGDRNTNYFHMKALLRRKKNFISELKQLDGSWTSNAEQLANLARQFFLDLYSLEDPSFTPLPLRGAFPPLSESAILHLDRAVSLEEVPNDIIKIGEQRNKLRRLNFPTSVE
ncbi:hypothetical protein K1719_015822 [Acacia pycnantha]|nr:hypothetical protein K1719_015822 [Acacia pycnantha]